MGNWRRWKKWGIRDLIECGSNLGCRQSNLYRKAYPVCSFRPYAVETRHEGSDFGIVGDAEMHLILASNRDRLLYHVYHNVTNCPET